MDIIFCALVIVRKSAWRDYTIHVIGDQNLVCGGERQK
jgi:hypothetical protein